MGDRQEWGSATQRDEGASDQAQTGSQVDPHEGAPATRFVSSGAIPPVLGFGPTSMAPSASQRAYGSPLPLTDESDLEVRANRMEAERLLTSKGITSGHDAIAALDLLLGLPDGQRGKAIDQLKEPAFDNLLDRLSDDQRARLGTLVDGSNDPKRKLKLWAAQHKSRARTDLRRYEGDFGDPEADEQTDEQAQAQARYERREHGVDATDAEVTRECGALLKKGDALTVADVDAMRARKDRELAVEMEHNVNLNAESAPREDGSQVQWETDELAQVDAAFDKLPDAHVRDANSVSTFTRRANRHFTDTKGGQYNGAQIDIYDNAHQQPPGRAEVSPVEYAVTHEVGHEAASEHASAFDKFKKTAGWTTVNEDKMRDQGVTDDDLGKMQRPTEVDDKIYHRGEKGAYDQVDATAIPADLETKSKRWEYARNNAHEHFGEVYAMAAQTPELLYTDYVTRPAEDTRALQKKLAERRQSRSPDPTEMKELERDLARAVKLQHQRRELFEIVRNDVFGADKGTRAAIARLRERGLDANAIHAFEEQAARVSTPVQLAELERKAMR